MSIAARVYLGTTPATLIAGLPHSRERQWLDQLNETGSGSLAVHVNDDVLTTNPAILQYGNIVRLSIDGTDRFAFIIEQRNVDPAPTGELGERYRRISGRGVLALLEDAIVYPEAGYVDSKARQRAFDYTAIAYDDSAWTAAKLITVTDFSDRPDPSMWGDPTARYIWSRDPDGVDGSHPVGTSYFRKDFNLATGTDVQITAAIDNTMRVFLDGEEIISAEDEADIPLVTYSVFKRLGSGTHQLAISANNIPHADGTITLNPAMLILSVMNVDGNSLIMHTDASWLALDYPTEVPGMSLGEIIRILLEEAQARGALTGITWTFTDTQDSASSAWAEEPDIIFDIGTSLLDVMRTLVEQYVDMEMTSALVFKVYNKGTLGTNLTGSVNLQVGVHFEEATGAGEDHSTNVLLARDATGLLTQQTHAASVAARKRREVYLETATAPTEERAQAISVEVLDEFAQPSFQLSAKVIKTSGPYTTWGPGDTILMPNPAFTAQAATVLSIAVEEDEAGHEVFHTEAVMLDATS